MQVGIFFLNQAKKKNLTVQIVKANNPGKTQGLGKWAKLGKSISPKYKQKKKPVKVRNAIKVVACKPTLELLGWHVALCVFLKERDSSLFIECVCD